jgi:hypothetical protein
MRSRVRMLYSFVFGWGLLLAGCGGDSSVQPTAATSRASPAPVTPRSDPGQTSLPGERWKLTTTLRSVSGPDVCWVPATNIGKSTDWLMAIQRSGESIHLVYDVRNFPFPDVNHVGKVVAHDVVATSEGWTGAYGCGGVRYEFRFEANMVGRFSAGGGALAGREVWSYRLTSGETVRMHFDWSAIPQ